MNQTVLRWRFAVCELVHIHQNVSLPVCCLLALFVVVQCPPVLRWQRLPSLTARTGLCRLPILLSHRCRAKPFDIARTEMTGPPPFIQASSSSHPSAFWLRANKSTPQKSITGQLGSRSFKYNLSNCEIVAIGLTVDAHAMRQPSSTMTVSGASRDVRSKELQNADPRCGPLSY
jgi:hypothetical protein